MEEKSYAEFFKEDLYEGFVDYLLTKYTARQVIDRLKSHSLMNKKGVHYDFRREFNEFLAKNPKIWKRFSNADNKFMGLRNISGGNLQFPVDVKDDGLMIRETVRIPLQIPVEMPEVERPSKEMAKRAAVNMQNQIVRGSQHDKPYLHPKRLTVHFKESFATRTGKTTESFMVESRSDAMDIILDRYEKKVAYATIQGEEEFVFVRPRNGKKKRNRKLRG